MGKFNLPNPIEENKSTAEEVLKSLQDSIGDKYNKKILGTYTQTSEMKSEGSFFLGYAFYLYFTKEDFRYRLFELISEKEDNNYPYKLTAFYGPPTEYGTVC